MFIKGTQKTKPQLRQEKYGERQTMVQNPDALQKIRNAERKTAKLIVAISHRKGVICCERYEKMDGPFFASFVEKHFRKLMKKSRKRTRMWIQDDDPCQNSAAVRKVISLLNRPLLKIPPRCPDLSPIENVFHLVRKQLDKDALAKNICCESMGDFEHRTKATFMAIPTQTVDKTISSMSSRVKQIVREKGERLKY